MSRCYAGTRPLELMVPGHRVMDNAVPNSNLPQDRACWWPAVVTDATTISVACESALTTA